MPQKVTVVLFSSKGDHMSRSYRKSNWPNPTFRKFDKRRVNKKMRRIYKHDLDAPNTERARKRESHFIEMYTY